MHELTNHLRFATRQLLRNPGFALTAILTLAIGIGATTAIFSIFYSVLLRPLPFPEPQRLVSVNILNFPTGSGAKAAGSPESVSYPDFYDWRSQNHSFESLASYHNVFAAMNPNGSRARMLIGATVSSDFFHVLGVAPAMGNSFTRAQEKAGDHSVILSHALWVSDFNASPNVLGKTIKLFDIPYTVIGVMPAAFGFPMDSPAPEFWIGPAHDDEGSSPSTQQRGWMQLQTVGRLEPGITIAQAQAEMDTIQEGIAKRYPDEDLTNRATKLEPLMQTVTGDARPALRILFAAVAALLLIACANVAGLLLARGSGRQAELAVRVALGASKGEIAFQLLCESLMLSVFGCAGGIVLALFMLKGLLRLVPDGIPRVGDASIDAPVLLFSFAVSLATGVLFGLLPARRLSQIDPVLALRDNLRTATAGRKQHRLHSGLVVLETALGLVLLVGAGLLIRSFMHTLSVDPGFNPNHMLTFRVGVSPIRYKEDTDSLAMYRSIQAKLRALPGVQAATAVFPLPLSGSTFGLTFDIEGRVHAPGDSPDAQVSIVDPSYFKTMGIPIVRGRSFSAEEDQIKGRPAIMINQALADHFFPGQDPIGKHIQPGFSDDHGKKPMCEIIGIVANVKRSSMTEETVPEYYMPYAPANVSSPYYALRVSGDPLSYINSVRAVVASVDKEAPIYRIHTYDDLVALRTAGPRFQTLLLTAFAAIALLLAAIGLYAVLSYMVVQRTHEIGLRMALGAQRRDVLDLVLRRGVSLAIAGLAIGVVASLMLTRFMGTLLFGVKPLDAITFVTVAAVMLLVSALASLIPATRAASLDPMKTLRDQ